MLPLSLIMARDLKKYGGYKFISNMTKVLEKVERRLGEKLFIKGDRCIGPKCAFTRRNYAPGAHGKAGKGRRRDPSEFGQLMREKQKIRFIYGLDDHDMKKYITMAVSKKTGLFGTHVIQQLECRLDNIVYRLGFAYSRRAARQAISHGHFMVNGKRVFTPSFQVKKGDIVSVREQSLSSGIFAHIDDKMRSYEAPQWLSLDKNKKLGTMSADPEVDDVGMNVDITKVKEFYSR